MNLNKCHSCSQKPTMFLDHVFTELRKLIRIPFRSFLFFLRFAAYAYVRFLFFFNFLQEIEFFWQQTSNLHVSYSTLSSECKISISILSLFNQWSNSLFPLSHSDFSAFLCIVYDGNWDGNLFDGNENNPCCFRK